MAGFVEYAKLMEAVKGIPVSPGVVIGRALVLDDALHYVPHRIVPEDRVEAQMERLDKALAAATVELEEDRARVEEQLGPEPAKIFEFHLGMLHDPALIEPARTSIQDDRMTAESAVAKAFRTMIARFRAMENEVFRQKTNDLMDLDRRVLSKLMGETQDRLERQSEPVVVISHDMTPARAASLDLNKVIGFATDAGGRTSHTSIVAAALGIPVVVGCKKLTQYVEDGDELVIDGKSGVVVVRPDAETLEQYRIEIERISDQQIVLREYAELESVTRDGVRINLMGNIEFAYEIEAMISNGGDGVGLYRTEFLYLTSKTEPTEEEQFQNYKQCVELLGGLPLTIRTLDLGADKYTQQRAEEPERNPFLGLRSIRYCLQNLGMFKTQLRAIMRASAFGPIKVMFPLVSTTMELRQAKMILMDVMEECKEEGIEIDQDIPIGVMIEVPSAALTATTMAKEVSFFSIGTNDLIQYTLAVDRANEKVANLYCGAHPAVLHLIKGVIRAGRRLGVDTSICGEIAGDVEYTMLLLGMGLRTLSLVPSQLPNVKRVIRSVDMAQCERLARKVGSFDSERQVLKCLRQQLDEILPGMNSGRAAN